MVVTLPTTEGTDELKVLTYLATLLAGLGYTVWLLGWLLSGVPTVSPAAIVASAQAPTAFVSAAWLMGAGRILADGNRGGHGTPSGRWWHRAGLAVAVYAAITALLPPLVTGAPWFPSAVVLVTGFLLVSASSPVCRWILHRRDVDALPTARMPTAERQLAVGGALVGACSQAIFWVSLWQPGSAADPTTVLWDATQLSLFGSGIAAMIAGIVLRDRILNDARVNPDHVRLLHRVVYRGERLPEDGDLRDQAVRYAVAVPHRLFFQLLFLPLLFLSQALQTYWSADRDGASMLSQLTGLALGIALIVATTYYLRQGRVGRRYALEHSVMP